LSSALDGLYLDARYPGALGLLPEGKPTGHEVRTFLEFASAIFRRSKEIVQRDDQSLRLIPPKEGSLLSYVPCRWGCNELETYEQGEAMPYVTSIERIGIKKGILMGEEKGRQEGIPQGEAQILRRQLTRRFGPLPDWAEAKLSESSTDQLEHWADRILDAESLDAVFTG
jgi:hypothetical protein